MKPTILATTYICTSENVLAANAVNTYGVAVSYNNRDVTNLVMDNGQGLDIIDGGSIIINFPDERSIISVAFLSDSNVKSYSVYYTKSDDNEYILESVSRREFEIICTCTGICFR